LPPNYDPRAAFEAIIREEDELYEAEGDDEFDSQSEPESEDDEDPADERVRQVLREGQAQDTACSSMRLDGNVGTEKC
jgi:hypothetical protein